LNIPLGTNAGPCTIGSDLCLERSRIRTNPVPAKV
jgi:hypothetical protein